MTRQNNISNITQGSFNIAKIYFALWITIIIILPFFIDYFHLSPYTILHSQKSESISPIGISTFVASENIWILPRVFLLLIFAVFFLPFIKRFWKTTPYTFLLLVYFLLTVISGLASRDSLQYVFLGGQGRDDGLIYVFALVVFAIAGYLLYTIYPNKLPIVFGYSLAGAGSLQSIIVIFQRLGHDLIKQSPYEGYVIGTIGSNGMLAAYLLVAALLTAGLLLANNFTTHSRLARVALAIALILNLWALGLTYNRSAILGLYVAVLILFFFNYKNKRIWLITIILFFIPILSPFLTPNLSGAERALSNPKTVNTRLDIWSITIKAILRTPGQPLIGAGPDGLRLSILKRGLLDDLLKEYRKEYGWKEKPVLDRSLDVSDIPPRYRVLIIKFPTTGKVRFMYVTLDKAHNLLLDRAVNYGLFSAIIWFILYVFPLIKLLRSNKLLEQTIGISILAIFIYYIFWFPVPQVEPIHMALLAIAWGMASLANESETAY